ncbi:arylsulfatase B-like isoform X1 [Tachypleus tridentatus]|uniref:arylsulfatase B-like isoform X1 n=2 Tax=Tachypleus tridentatus TaxID=6853 RepID=UPI003FD3C391
MPYENIFQKMYFDLKMKIFAGFIVSIFIHVHVAFSTRTSKKHPNIIIIVADDLGWNDISFHGSPQIPTPNIDALAANGIILNNYYVSPICTPSRGALMSGLYPIHTGLQHDVIYAGEPWGLPLELPILPTHLKKLGYSTQTVGKWHLGFFKKEYTPTYRGFDSHFGYWTGHEDYYDHTAVEGNNWGLDFRHNLSLVTDALGKYATELFTDHAIDIIQKHNKSRPLFLYLAHLAVHSANPYNPLQAPSKYIKRFPHIKDRNRRIFAGMASALDDSVGRVIDNLRNQGMLQNSIVVFTTDNGGPAAGFNQNAASNWPLRGVKFTLWEGGIRGAAFIWSPLLRKKGIVSTQMMHICDWLPTLYYAAGGNPADLGPLDGYNMWKVLSDNTPSPRKEILHNIDPVVDVGALRIEDYKIIYGTGNFQDEWDGWYGPSGREPKSLILNKRYFKELLKMQKVLFDKSTMFNSNYHSPAEVKCGPKPANASKNCQLHKAPCLFNIVEDPCEYHNLANQKPEVMKMLLQRLAEYRGTAVPPRNKPKDPQSVPPLHGYSWTNWMDDKKHIL